MTQDQAAALLNALPSDDRTAFLNELPLDLAMQLLSMLTPDERHVAQSLLALLRRDHDLFDPAGILRIGTGLTIGGIALIGF